MRKKEKEKTNRNVNETPFLMKAKNATDTKNRLDECSPSFASSEEAKRLLFEGIWELLHRLYPKRMLWKKTKKKI